MPSDREKLQSIQTFPSLVKYLRDDLGWHIVSDDFDDLTFDWEPEELGIDLKTAAKIQQIKQLRPLDDDQPWGIFFVKFEPKRLPVVAMRRLLRGLAVKKRASANQAERPAWRKNDLLFISAYGENTERHITFAHFAENEQSGDLPILRVLGWDGSDTPLHIDHVHQTLMEKLRWPDDTHDLETWRESWSSAFVLRPREVIKTSKKLAVHMAAVATQIRNCANAVLAVETESGPLKTLQKAFREALIHDLDEDDFADMYAQTITYGLFAAAMSRTVAGEGTTLVVDNLADMVPVTNPFLKELLGTFLEVGGRKGHIDFDELGVNDVVELLLDADLEAIKRDFGDRRQEDDPVIHFYELFLSEYDRKKRVRRGVFYTPQPVVSFIVRSVHEILQTEFGLKDGLADTTTWDEIAAKHKDITIPEGTDPNGPFVVILDPATGTATFLVEVIDVIHKAMTAKWRREGRMELELPELWNGYVPKHLLPRLHGYELMMAPYAIAHMKIGLKLSETGYRFGSDERARVYLTNALESHQDFSDTFEQMAPALAHEAQAVNDVKRHQRFTIVIGNPPYSGHTANSGSYIHRNLRQTLCDGANSYFEVDGKPLGERQPKWLNDDYVQFFRLTQKMISETGCGVASLVTNHGYLDNPTFRGMRQSLKCTFDRIIVIDLHGNSKKAEQAPIDSNGNDNVFDIQQGVAISALTSHCNGRHVGSSVMHGELWGNRDHKYHSLLNSTTSSTDLSTVHSQPPLHLFIPQDVNRSKEYDAGTPLCEVMPVNCIGFQSHRDSLVLDFDRSTLLARIKRFSDVRVTDTRIEEDMGTKSTGTWSLTSARKQVRADLSEEHVQACDYRPFDRRYIYYHDAVVERRLFAVLGHLTRPNVAITTMRQTRASEWRHAMVAKTPVPAVYAEMKDGTSVFPLYLYSDINSLELFGSNIEGHSARRANINDDWWRALANHFGLSLIQEGRGSLVQSGSCGPEDVLHCVYAQLHSPSYRARYFDSLRLSFPRIFVPKELSLLVRLATLGGELVALHLLETPRSDTRLATYDGPVGPQVEKISYSDQTIWLDKAKTCGFKGIPEEVWNFHIGGYQVCEKWLKDRQAKGGKNPRPGRVLTDEDIDHYQNIVVALSETIRIMAEIDQVIESHGGWPDAFVNG